jgi:hypothetical protein
LIVFEKLSVLGRLKRKHKPKMKEPPVLRQLEKKKIRIKGPASSKYFKWLRKSSQFHERKNAKKGVIRRSPHPCRVFVKLKPTRVYGSISETCS